MTRAEAIRFMKKVWRETVKDSFAEEAYEMAIQALEAEPHWIPCSEKLPEVGQSVLMSIGGMYTAEGNLREDGNWSQYRWDAIQKKNMVEAWMPLPEPWEGDAE